jgi:hypothetical protein
MCLYLDDSVHETLPLNEFPLKEDRMKACRELCDYYDTVYDGDFCCNYFDRQEEGYPDETDPWDSCWFVEGGWTRDGSGHWAFSSADFATPGAKALSFIASLSLVAAATI